MNVSISEKEYIAIATDSEKMREREEHSILLGNNSLTHCELKMHSNKLRKRGPLSVDIYVGRNKQLNKDLSYNIFMVTATLSETAIIFKTSSALIVTSKADSPFDLCTIALPVAGVCLAIAVIIIIALVKDRSKIKALNQRTAPENENRKMTMSNDPHPYEYPTVQLGANTSYYKNIDCNQRKTEYEQVGQTTSSTSHVTKDQPAETQYELSQNLYEMIKK